MKLQLMKNVESNVSVVNICQASEPVEALESELEAKSSDIEVLEKPTEMLEVEVVEELEQKPVPISDPDVSEIDSETHE